jgi:hypothetical protein
MITLVLGIELYISIPCKWLIFKKIETKWLILN